MSESGTDVSDRLRATLGAFDAGDPGEPFTTSEVADRLDVSRRSTYERLDRLVEAGLLETKKVGARGRVWWRPVERDGRRSAHDGAGDPGGPPGPTDGTGADRSGAGSGVWPDRSGDGRPFAERVLDSQSAVVVAVDGNGDLHGFNQRTCDVTGLSAAELRDLRLPDLVADGAAERVTAAMARVRDGERTTVEAPLVTADGEPTPYEFRCAPLGDAAGEGAGLTAVGRDVSDRRERRRDLARFRRAVEASGQAVYATDPDGTITDVNSAFEALTGYAASDVLGETAAVLHPDAGDGPAGDARWPADPADGVRETDVVGRRPDGTLYHAELTLAPVTDDGEVRQYVAVLRDVTDRRRFEERLKRLAEVSHELLRAADAADVAGRVVETVTEVLDLPAATVFAYDEASDRLVPTVESAAGDVWDDLRAVDADETSIVGRVYAAGDARYYEDVTGSGYLYADPDETAVRTGLFVPLDEHGVLVVGATDVDAFDADTRQLVSVLAATAEAALARVDRECELERRVRQLEGVADLGQRALEGVDHDELLAEAVERVAATLDTDVCEVFELDEDGTALTRRAGVGWDDDRRGTTVPVDGDAQAAHTLAAAQPVVVEDVTSETRFGAPDRYIDRDRRSGVSVAVGPADDPWGVLATYDAEPREYTPQDVTFVESVATVVATAITRHEDERELVRQREQLAALNSLNEVVREITDAVVDQSTREEIEAAVCEHLAAATSYEFAWIGEVDHASRTVESRTAAGVEDYLADATISVDPDDERGRGPVGRALRTGEAQTTQDVRTDPRHEPWRDVAEAYGYLSVAAVPIAHEDTTYGVLAVYADRPYAFTGRERDVVGQLGEVIGHAIAAVERKRALMADEVVELGFAIPDVFDMVGADPVDGTVTITETVPVSEESYLAYGTVSDGGRDVIETLVASVPHWDAVTVRDDEDADERPFELRLTAPPVLSTVASAGGTVVEAVVEDGAYHMTLQVPPGAEVRRVIETVTDAYPEAEMVTRRQTTRTPPGDSPTESVAAALTDRQRAALRAAYHAGFFEWPRTASGEDVADSLGISPPTFHQHVRKAERKVLDAVVEALE